MNTIRESRMDSVPETGPDVADSLHSKDIVPSPCSRLQDDSPDSSGCASDEKCGRLPRLLKRAEFVAAAAGRRMHTSRMTVQILQRPVLEAAAEKAAGGIRGPRFGLTVTKKTANAVGRNRIRRRLRGLLCRLRPHWPQDDIDFVIVGRAEMLTAGADVIEADLKRAFSSPARQGNPHGRQNRPSSRGRGKGRDTGDARTRNTKQQDPTGGS